MAEIRVLYTGLIRLPSGKSRQSLTIEDGATVREALRQLGFKPREMPFIAISRDAQALTLEHVLSNCDQIVLSVLAGGG